MLRRTPLPATIARRLTLPAPRVCATSSFVVNMMAAPSLCAPRRMLHSTVTAVGNQPTGSDSNRDGYDEDDDFVHDAVIGSASASNNSGGAATTAGSHAAVTRNPTAPAIARGTDDDSALVPLGIERLPDIPEGTRFSRLNKVVVTEPVGRSSTSRAASTAPPAMDEITELLSEEMDESARGADGAHHAAESLPFEDPNFAENILRMDVEGALDDTWQDAAEAKVEDVEAIVGVLNDSRVRDLTVIDVRAKTSNFDFIIVATCDSQRHMTMAAWAVSEADKWQRVAKVSRRKADELWDVVPVGRILVNLMMESYRNEVNIERKWAVTRSMDPVATAHATVSESRQLRQHGLWTLTMNLQDLEDFEVDYCKDVLLSQM